MKMNRIFRLVLGAAIIVPLLAGQQPDVQGTPAFPPQAATPGDQIRPNYTLGPSDQIVIRAFQMEEINEKPFRIDSEGEISLPVLGKIHAGGLTVEQLEAELLQRLKVLVKNPQVSVNVVQFRSEPVFLEGAFKSPGIVPLQGSHTLLEVIASNGGLL